MGLQVLISSRSTSTMAESLLSPFLMRLSTRCLKFWRASATAELRAIIAEAQLAEEPGARNSKRLPVKAKGDVRLRSVLSIIKSGIWGISISMPCLPLRVNRSSLSDSSIWSSSSVSCFPRKLLIMAGGASLPPRRWAFVALMIEAFSSPLWRYTAINVSTMKVTKRRFSSGVLPGAWSSVPLSAVRLQLLCLPLPLIPSKGFSWSSTRNPWLRATRFISDISSMLWSTAKLHSSKIGANSNWLGATSLWRVLQGIASSKAWISRSFIKACTRSGMVPK